MVLRQSTIWKLKLTPAPWQITRSTRCMYLVQRLIEIGVPRQRASSAMDGKKNNTIWHLAVMRSCDINVQQGEHANVEISHRRHAILLLVLILMRCISTFYINLKLAVPCRQWQAQSDSFLPILDAPQAHWAAAWAPRYILPQPEGRWVVLPLTLSVYWSQDLCVPDSQNES